jgi:ATP-binding cassette, subfamily B, bacterial HlyB/CyaB
MAAQSKLLEEIHAKSLLDVIPQIEDLVLEHGELTLYQAGEKVCEQGQNLTHYFMPISQPLKITQFTEENTNEKFLGYIERCRSLALKELLQHAQLPFTAITEAKTTVLKIEKAVFLNHIKKSPKVEHYLKLVTSSSGARSFKTFLEEAHIPEDIIIDIFFRIDDHQTTLQPGEALENQNDYMYLISSGAFEAQSKPGAEKPYKVSLGEGAFFGGEALVPPFESSYNIAATQTTRCLKLDLKFGRPLFEKHKLAETLFDEPWIQKQKPHHARTVEGVLSLLPGTALTREELTALGIHINPSDLRLAQTDHESFTASLINLSSLLKVPVNASRFEDQLSLNRPVSALILAELLEEFGMMCQHLQADANNLTEQQLPALVMLGQRLCVLLKVNAKKEYFLHEPSQGFIRIGHEDFLAHWDQSFIEVRISHDLPAASEEPPKKGAESEKRDINPDKATYLFSSFIREYGPFKKPLLNVVGLSLLGFVFGVISPRFAQAILDEALSLRDMPMLISMAIGLIMVISLNSAITVATGWIQTEITAKYDLRIGNTFFRKAVALPEKFFAKQKVGEILSLMAEMNQIRDFLSKSALQIITNVISLVIYAVILLTYSWKITLLGFGLLALLLLTVALYRNKLQENYDAAFEAAKEAQSLVAEQVTAISSIKASGAEDIMRFRWEKVFLRGVQYRRKLQLQNTAIGGMIQFFVSATKVGALWISASMVVSKELSPGSVMAIVLYLDNMTFPMMGLATLLIEYVTMSVSAKKVNRVLHGESEEKASNAAVKHSINLHGKIKLDRVSFRYDEKADWVLRDIDLRIYPKQVIAIVGRSGCGKTTLANLIAGALKPTTGRIYFDDFDTHFLSLNNLRQQIGYIMQDNQLFAGSLRENIAFRDIAPDDSHVHKVAEQASASFVTQFPAGLSHFLSEGGMGLSGGQKQRLAIARTLYDNPRILIMDEATSALDAESERAIIGNMKQILQGRTALIIAHRLSTIRNADRILVMHEGQIVEEGTHAALLEKGGFYADLFENQANMG